MQKAAAEDPDDKKNAVCEIQSGVGGDESALFVAVLYKMYEEFLTAAKHSVETIDFTPGNMGGFKNISFIVKGKTPYGLLKHESGAHRVQRVPTTETKGRVHTSIAAVTVLPEMEVEQVDINRADVKVETYNSGGKGGQHGNRSMNAVKLTHLPTGISACSQVKSYAMNLKMAWKTLATRIADTALQRTETAASEEKKRLRGSGMRNERIRTYNYPQDRVTDHRIKKSYALQQVIAGKLQPILDDLKEHDL